VCPGCRCALSPGGTGATCAECRAHYPAQSDILRLAVGRQGAAGYDPHFFRTLEQVEESHFWFVTRREVILEALRRAVPDLCRRRLFDIGCGSGGVLTYLRSRGVAVSGACDAYLESLEIVRRRISVPLVLVDEGRLPPLGSGHDLLALFDVLEHVDDDRGMLHFLHWALAPGGVVALTVPAHPSLFGERDELAHHRRRYRRRELREKLEEAGFKVRVLSHFMAPLVPPLLVMQALSRIRPRSPGLRDTHDLEFRVIPLFNGMMRGLLALERRILRLVALPVGSSLIAVAAREGAGTGSLPGAVEQQR
jgi:SAM-dependent methyltransferase